MIAKAHANGDNRNLVPDFDPALRELLGDACDAPEAPFEEFEEIDPSVPILFCPQCWETGLTLETLPHKPGCPLAHTAVS